MTVSLPLLAGVAALVVAQIGAPVVTKPPEVITSVAPVYPEAARAERRGGTVALSLQIDVDGSVAFIRVAESAGADLDWAAMGALSQFTFSPAEIDGKPALVEVTYRLAFEVPAAVEPPPAVAPQPDDRAPFTLSGRVRRAGSVEPLPFAEVVLLELREGGQRGAPVVTAAGEDGRFAFGPLPEGPYRIEVAAVGVDAYEPLVDEQYFAPGRHELDLAMVPRQSNAFETVVRRQRGEPPVSRVSLSRDEVTGIPGTYGDALRVLESLPGVARAPLLGGALMVRGGYPADTAIHFEGVPIPVLYHFGGFTSVINGAFIDEISFMPGGYPARYGNATAGIVDVKAHELDDDTFKTHFDVDALDLGFFFGGHVARVPGLEGVPELRVGFAARRSHAEIPGNLILSSGPTFGAPIPFLPVPLYYDYQLKLESDVSSTSTLSLFAFGAEDSWAILGEPPELGLDGNGEELDFETVLNTFLGNRWHRLLAGWELRPLRGVTHSLRPWVGFTRRGLLSEGVAVPLLSGTTLDSPTDELNYGFRDEVAIRMTPWLRGLAGVEHNGASYTLELIPSLLFDPDTLPDDVPRAADATLAATAVYGELQLGPMSGLSVVPGVRAELSSLTFAEADGRAIYGNGRASKSVVDSWTLDPRVSLRYTVDPTFTLKGAFGTFHQRARAQSAAFDNDSDPLASPTALHVIGGFEAKLEGPGPVLELLHGVTFDAQVYGVRRWQLTRDSQRLYVPGQQAPPIATLGSYDSYGSGNTLGFELLLRAPPTRTFFGWISYTFSRTEVALGDRREARVPFPFDQTHNLVMVGKVNLPWQMTFGGRFAFVTGNPGPIPDSVATNHDLNFNSYTPILSSLRPSRLAPFHRLDLRLDKRWIFEWASVVGFVEVINVYNWPNPEVVFPGGDFRAREVRTLLPGPPLLPLIGAELDL